MIAVAALMAAALVLKPAPKLAGGVEAMPRIGAPMTSQAKRINTAIAAEDQRWAKDRSACLRQGKESYVERGVRVTMAGPEFLAVEAAHDSYCDGAAHPNQWIDYLAWDLTTGAGVRWNELIPGVTMAAPYRGQGDASRRVEWPAVQAVYQARVRGEEGKDPAWWRECREMVEWDEGEFLIGLDGEGGGVLIQPNWASHAQQNCAVAVTLTGAELKALGAAPRLIEALAAAAGP